MLAINNVELISDRPLETNLREIAEVKKRWPDRAVIVSAMVESKPETWQQIIRQIEDTGADAIELNYGCPHGMSERGMGAAVGQVPEYCEKITGWVKAAAHIPIIVKLTPNVTNIVMSARAGIAGGADALSLINTINSIVGVDLDTLQITPNIGGKGGHGGYAGPAVKPIALNMLSSLGTDNIVSSAKLPISGMGGIATWRDAAEFLLLGATSLQVCTSVMHYGFRIIEDLCDGLSNWMDEKGFKTIDEVVGKSLHRISDFKDFDLAFRAVARIDTAKCIKCDICYVACNDTAHQCIDLIAANGSVVEPQVLAGENGKDHAVSTRPQPKVREEDCVGCRLCYNVCPVEGCIEMVELPPLRESTTWDKLSKEQPLVTESWDAMEAYRETQDIHIH
jgi:dihydropyrimidine dehydrogenase (NAD+) subunit PreA